MILVYRTAYLNGIAFLTTYFYVIFPLRYNYILFMYICQYFFPTFCIKTFTVFFGKYIKAAKQIILRFTAFNYDFLFSEIFDECYVLCRILVRDFVISDMLSAKLNVGINPQQREESLWLRIGGFYKKRQRRFKITRRIHRPAPEMKKILLRRDKSGTFDRLRIFVLAGFGKPKSRKICEKLRRDCAR